MWQYILARYQNISNINLLISRAWVDEAALAWAERAERWRRWKMNRRDEFDLNLFIFAFIVEIRVHTLMNIVLVAESFKQPNTESNDNCRLHE